MKQWYLMVGLLLVWLSAMAMEEPKDMESSNYFRQLEESFFEQTIPDQDGRNININLFVSSLSDSNDIDVKLLKRVLKTLSPDMYNEIVLTKATCDQESTLETKQLRVFEAIIKRLSIQLDNIHSDHTTQNKKQIEEMRFEVQDMKFQKEKTIKYAQCASISSFFLFLWAVIATYCVIAY